MNNNVLKYRFAAVLAAAGVLLASCGGGGGEVKSGPTNGKVEPQKRVLLHELPAPQPQNPSEFKKQR